MGVVGCPRNCAEATVKDIGLVGQDGSWQVVVGGAAGKSVRKADLLITVETTEKPWIPQAVLPVLPRERQLPRTHIRFRGTAWNREGAQRDGVRAGRRENKRCGGACRNQRHLSYDAWLEGGQPDNCQRSSCRSSPWKVYV